MLSAVLGSSARAVAAAAGAYDAVVAIAAGVAGVGAGSGVQSFVYARIITLPKLVAGSTVFPLKYDRSSVLTSTQVFPHRC